MISSEHHNLRLKTILDYAYRLHTGTQFNFEIFFINNVRDFIKKYNNLCLTVGDNLPDLRKILNNRLEELERLIYEPHPITISEIINKCNLCLNLAIGDVYNSDNSNNETILSAIDDLTNSFNELLESQLSLFSKNEDTISIVKKASSMLQEQTNNPNISIFPTISAEDYLIITTTSFLFYCFLTIDELHSISRFLQYIMSEMSQNKKFKGVLPHDIYSGLKHLPQEVTKGIIYYLVEDDIIDRQTYYTLANAIKTDDENAFISELLKGKGLSWFDNYYYMIELSAVLYNIISEQYFFPGKYFDEIKDFISRTNRRIDKSTCILSIFDKIIHIDDIIPNNYKVLFDEICFNDEMKTLYSQEVDKYRNADTSIHIVKSTNQDSVSLIEGKKDELNNTNNQVDLNCIDEAKESLDEFIKYLAWRNYISEDDIESFKYIVFGGQSPSNFNKEMKFSFNLEGAKPLLANILWRLRKDAPNQIIVIFGENVTQSNWSIGTKPASQRVFVDLCLFFPFLISKLKLKNNKNVEEVKNKLNTCVIDLLNDNEDKPYSLRDIQNLQESKGEYWIVK